MQLKRICLLLVAFVWCKEVYSALNDSESQVLTRKKRFLLFTPGSHILLTSSFGKGLVFSGPAGYALLGELDLYYPLPDFGYQASALKLGKIAMYPPKKTPAPPPPPPPPPKKPEGDDHHHHHHDHHDHHQHHHDGGEVPAAEVEQYLKDHPGTWVPPGWGHERADWNEPNAPYSSHYWAPERMEQSQYRYPPASSTLHQYLGGPGTSGNFGWQARTRRSALGRAAIADERMERHEREKWLSGEAFNISQHGDWEHFHHYRDRRALFSHLEETISSVTGMHMKECILRSICEARHMLPPPGRSMSMDIFRVLFSFPLDEALDDDYSNALRDDNVDCRARYGSGCPISLLDLVLFGKFEP